MRPEKMILWVSLFLGCTLGATDFALIRDGKPAAAIRKTADPNVNKAIADFKVCSSANQVDRIRFLFWTRDFEADDGIYFDNVGVYCLEDLQ